jgi:hypothetical protein
MPVAALVHRGVPGKLHHRVGHDRPVIDRLACAPAGRRSAVLSRMPHPARIQQAASSEPSAAYTDVNVQSPEPTS